MTAHATETTRHTSNVTIVLERHAYTDEPYKNRLSREEFPTTAAPIIRIPVPKKKEEAMEIPKYLLKMVFRKVYKLAQPRLMTILLKTASTNEPIVISKEAPVSSPADTAPIRYVMHIQAMENAPTMDLDII